MRKIQQLFSGIVLLVVFNVFQSHSFAASSVPNVLILGDSLSAAYNIPVDQSWPSLFTTNIRLQYPDASVINASISGETTFGGVQRLLELLDRHNPSILIIELGGNDGLRGLKFSQTADNFNQMISMAQQRDIEVLLIGIDLPPNLGPAYNQRFQQIFESVKAQHPIHFLPHFLEGVAADLPHLMQDDGIHPTAAAQPILADKIFNAISKLIN